jgi:hypothetical protein
MGSKEAAMPTIVESVLLFGLRGGARMGMPLALVARLEEVKEATQVGAASAS